MNTIFKYEISVEDHPVVEMPRNSDILKVGYQLDKLYVWARIETEEASALKHFRIFGTGHNVSQAVDDYIDTVFAPNGLVWHIFDNGWDE